MRKRLLFLFEGVGNPEEAEQLLDTVEKALEGSGPVAIWSRGMVRALLVEEDDAGSVLDVREIGLDKLREQTEWAKNRNEGTVSGDQPSDS